jgi:hypothetical protein
MLAWFDALVDACWGDPRIDVTITAWLTITVFVALLCVLTRRAPDEDERWYEEAPDEPIWLERAPA